MMNSDKAPARKNSDPVGVFDSGVGGVSVLREMARTLPRERFIYYGDNKNAPYGDRPEREILRLTLSAIEALLKQNIKALVIACNAATSAAVHILRERLQIPVIGVEPALKPAARMRVDGKVLVMATSATLRQGKFRRLLDKYGRDAVLLPCPGLMEFVERGELSGPALDYYLLDLFKEIKNMPLDAVVLGCTHYCFLKQAIANALPSAPLIDGNAGTARRLAHVLESAGLLSDCEKGGVEFHTSGAPERYIPLMEKLKSIG
jgi:glutamate racemase